MGKKSTPSAPDPVATASAQASANADAARESAKVNQIGTTGPWGRTYYTGTVGKDDRTQVTELSPAAQQIYNNQADIGQALSGYGRNLAQQIQGLQPFRINGASAAPPANTSVPPGAQGMPPMAPDILREPAPDRRSGGMPPMGTWTGGPPTVGGIGGSPTFAGNPAIPSAGRSTRVDFNRPSFGSGGPIDFNISDINDALRLAGLGQDRSGQGNYVAADFSGVPEGPWGQNRDQAISAVEKATYDRAYNQMQPEIQRQRAALETSLANQGIALGSDVYRKEMDRFERGIQNQLNDLSLGAVTAGRQEDSRLYNQALAGRGQAFDEAVQRYGISSAEDQRLFGQELAGGQFDQSERQRLLQTRGAKAAFDQSEAERLFNQAMAEAEFQRNEDQRMFGNDNASRDRAIQEMITERQMPMNELAAILQGSPAIQTPQAVNPGQYNIAPADIMGATYSNYQNQLQNAQANRQGLYSLLGTGANLAGMWAFSDRRLKSDIRQVGRLPNGLAVYAYTKFGRPEIGLMADEVREIRPWAVARIGGFDAVNYAEAMR